MGDDAAPPFPGVAVEYDVTCRLPDGTTLRADVYRPESGDSHPVLVQRTPYNKRVAGSQLAYAHPSWYARQGFLVVVQDCRGRGRSEGNFYPYRASAAVG